MNTQYPEALRLAQELDAYHTASPHGWQAAIELRRLHEVNAKLLEALKEVGAASQASVHPVFSRAARAAIAKATGETK